MKKSKDLYMDLHGEEYAKRYAKDAENALPPFPLEPKKELIATLEELINPFVGEPFGQMWTECQKALNNIDVVKWIDTVVEEAETYYFLDVTIGKVRVKYCEIRDKGFHVYLTIKDGSTHAKMLFDWGVDDQYNESFKEKLKKQFFDFLKENQSTIRKYV